MGDWLDPERTTDLAVMKERLEKEDTEPLEWYRVNKMVNSAENEGQELILPNILA